MGRRRQGLGLTVGVKRSVCKIEKEIKSSGWGSNGGKTVIAPGGDVGAFLFQCLFIVGGLVDKHACTLRLGTTFMIWIEVRIGIGIQLRL